jgi:hypothetical protein
VVLRIVNCHVLFPFRVGASAAALDAAAALATSSLERRILLIANAKVKITAMGVGMAYRLGRLQVLP